MTEAVSFPIDYVELSPQAWTEWDIAVQHAEYEMETQIDGAPYVRILDDGDLLVSADSPEGAVVSLRVSGKNWSAMYHA